MPKAKTPKNLVVDGTAKLAAKSKPDDKHEAPDLNIEEATVASPRPSRKRAGDYFDFDNEDVDAEPSRRPAEPKAAKPKKKTKTAAAGKDERSNEVEAKPAATARSKKGKGAKDDIAEPPSETAPKAVEKEKKSRKPKATEDNVAEDKLESSKKSKKAVKEAVADKKHQTDVAPKTAKAETETKAKKSKTAKAETKTKAKKSKAEKGVSEQETPPVPPDVTMDEGPFETLLDSEKGQPPGTTDKQSATGYQTAKAAKSAKKPVKESKSSNTESAKPSAAGTAADAAETVKKEVRAGPEKVKKVAKSMAPAAETSAGVADVVKKGVKAAAEKIKEGAKSKVSKPAKDDESVELTGSTKEQSKPEASKSKKRKAPPSADTDMVKTDILDPLSEDASTKQRPKKAKANTKSKSIGDTVGELLATATEGANAARDSLGGLATSIMGGATEAAEGATDAKKPVETSANKAKDKGKAIAEDVAESSGKVAAIDQPGDADSEDDSDDSPDDHTIALLAGFESDGDEGTISDSGFKQGQKIPRLPKAETTAKKLEDVKVGADEGPGVVYVGRIPHGFYEHEMREYFSQFGDISRLRLSRSRKSGASRHYAFVEFTSMGVAKIVADTMDNYLMFGRILKCKVIAKEQVHESLWKGANKRFNAVPWNKIHGRKFEMGLGREQWAGRIEGEKKRRASKKEKTKEIGYEFEAGELKGVDEVPVKDAAKKVENEEKFEEEKSLVTAPGGEDGNDAVIVSEEVKTKRVKKVKGKTADTTTVVTKKTKRALDVGEEAAGSVAKKPKKGKNTAA